MINTHVTNANTGSPCPPGWSPTRKYHTATSTKIPTISCWKKRKEITYISKGKVVEWNESSGNAKTRYSKHWFSLASQMKLWLTIQMPMTGTFHSLLRHLSLWFTVYMYCRLQVSFLVSTFSSWWWKQRWRQGKTTHTSFSKTSYIHLRQCRKADDARAEFLRRQRCTWVRVNGEHKTKPKKNIRVQIIRNDHNQYGMRAHGQNHSGSACVQKFSRGRCFSPLI